MEVERLGLQQFRVYRRQSLTFSPHLNVIEGPNAQGKTALLEALYLVALGTSFRTHHLAEFIQRGTAAFGVEVTYTSCGVTQQVKVTGTSRERQVFLNGVKHGSLAALVGGLKVVAFTPEDYTLVKGAPQLRRQYLDVLIGQNDPLYLHHLKRYNRAVKQRNCLLRAGSRATLDSWEYELAQAAAYLIIAREAAVEALAPRCERLYRQLSGSARHLTLRYQPGCSGAAFGWDKAQWHDYLCQLWHHSRPRDSIVGATLSGPHKDELILLLDDLELRHFGSEGERRTSAATLRLAEWEHVAALAGELPVLLIDDLTLGLDPQRQSHFLGYLAQAGQVFITTAQPLDLNICQRPVQHFRLPLPSPTYDTTFNLKP